MSKGLMGVLGAALGMFTACAPAGVTNITTAQAETLAESGNALVLDVRTPPEYAAGRIPGAGNISVQTLAARLSELPADKASPILVYCRSGHRSTAAARILSSAGYSNISNMTGGFLAWTAQDRPVEK